MIILTFGICGLLCCKDQQDQEATYNQNFQVGSIPGIKDFETFNEEEKHTDSLKTRIKKDWRHNRGRIFMNVYTNGKPADIDSVFITGLPLPCKCVIDHDTMFVRMGVGFFGGFGFNLKVFNDQFIGTLSEYTDSGEPYKTNLSDTSFSNYFITQNKYQYLILSDRPTLQDAQQLTGFMTFTSNNFYEKDYENRMDTNYLTGKIYFTCITQHQSN